MTEPLRLRRPIRCPALASAAAVAGCTLALVAVALPTQAAPSAEAKGTGAGTPAAPVDRADLDPTKIIGNRELPKVLYIVPWRKPMPSELNGKPVDSVLDEVLAPVDRDVFRREVQYHAQTDPPPQPKP
jgi:hypothetical protein